MPPWRAPAYKTAIDSALSRCGAALWALVLAGSFAHAQTYRFTTIAGSPGVSGTNDGVGAEARFNFPSELAVADSGRVFVCDFQSHTLRLLEQQAGEWRVTTIAGSPRVAGWADGTNTDIRLDRPCGIAMDREGNLFVAEVYNRVIRQISPAGTNWISRTLAGQAGQTGAQDGTNDQARFFNPRGMGIDESGALYVADSANHTIRRIAPMGEDWVVTTPAGQWPYFGFVDDINEWAEFNTPFSLRSTPDGTLFVADLGNHAVRKITRNGNDWVTTTMAGDGEPGATDGPGAQARFRYPAGIAMDTLGNVFVADQDNHTIRKLAPVGQGWTVSTIAGNPGEAGSAEGPGSDARFNKPWGVAVEASGKIFIADQRNHTIRVGIPQGPALQIETAAGKIVVSWPAVPGGFVLESSAALGPAASWTALTNGIVDAADRRYLTNDAGAAPLFYRLRGL